MIGNLKEQYNKIMEERGRIIEELNELKNNKIVKKYFELSEKSDTLLGQQKEFFKKIKIEEFSTCEHIWVTTLCDHDYMEGRTESYCGCIKCGLDQIVFRKSNSIFGTDFLNYEEKVMYDFMYNSSYMTGIKAGISCDFDLAKVIYCKIKEKHPNIDDDTAIKYLEIALDNIRNIKVSQERKENRAKRLSLSPKFNKWNAFDVHN